MRKTLCLLAALVLLSCVSAFPQGGVNSVVATYTTASVSATDSLVKVYSATGISTSPPTVLYVVDVGTNRGELMGVKSISSTNITVSRGQGGSQAAPHYSGAMVLLGRPDWFFTYDPVGTCTAASTHANPWVNTASGNQWLCSTLTHTWVPGFGNKLYPAQVTTAVASVAGATAPTGPLFHITGTNAITSWTVGVGMRGNSFCVIPDAAYTTVAGNNIGKSTTAVASQVQCWAWDATNSAWQPTY